METILKFFLNLCFHFKEGVASFVFAINGDVYLGDSYHCHYEKLVNGKVWVYLRHIESGLHVEGTGNNLIETKLSMVNELDNMILVGEK